MTGDRVDWEYRTDAWLLAAVSRRSTTRVVGAIGVVCVVVAALGFSTDSTFLRGTAVFVDAMLVTTVLTALRARRRGLAESHGVPVRARADAHGLVVLTPQLQVRLRWNDVTELEPLRVGERDLLRVVRGAGVVLLVDATPLDAEQRANITTWRAAGSTSLPDRIAEQTELQATLDGAERVATADITHPAGGAADPDAPDSVEFLAEGLALRGASDTFVAWQRVRSIEVVDGRLLVRTQSAREPMSIAVGDLRGPLDDDPDQLAGAIGDAWQAGRRG